MIREHSFLDSRLLGMSTTQKAMNQSGLYSKYQRCGTLSIWVTLCAVDVVSSDYDNR